MIRGVDKLAKITELGGEWWEPELCPAHPSRLFSPRCDSFVSDSTGLNQLKYSENKTGVLKINCFFFNYFHLCSILILYFPFL